MCVCVFYKSRREIKINVRYAKTLFTRFHGGQKKKKLFTIFTIDLLVFAYSSDEIRLDYLNAYLCHLNTNF